MNLIDDDEGGPVEDLNLARQPVRIARMTEELLLVGEIHVRRGRQRATERRLADLARPEQ